MTQNLIDTITSRRSIRNFKPTTEIPQADIEKILQAATAAPSAHNIQPWRYHVITKNSKTQLIQALDNSKQIPQEIKTILIEILKTVPVAIAIENPDPKNKLLLTQKPGQTHLQQLHSHINQKLGGDQTFTFNPRMMALGDFLGTAASIQNLLLAVHALGYGAVWIGFPPTLEATKQVIAVEGELVGLIPIGVPADTQVYYISRSRKTVAQVTKYYQ